jgi:hypothetical protein
MTDIGAIATEVVDGVAGAASAVEASPVDKLIPPQGQAVLDIIAHLNALDGWLTMVANLFPPHVNPGPPPTPPSSPSS